MADLDSVAFRTKLSLKLYWFLLDGWGELSPDTLDSENPVVI